MAKFNLKVSIKHLQVDKANSMILIAAAATTAIVIFSIVASQALIKELVYKNKVINLRSKANQQLVTNFKAVDTLVNAYQTFEGASESSIGTADKNSIIILDALPSKYDFPALATSLEGLITSSGAKVDSITGTDQEAQAVQDSAAPQPIEIPFQISASGGYANIQTLISNLEHSIRPINISSLTFSGNDASLQASITAKTYYQPEKKLTIQQTIVTNGKSNSSASSAKVAK